MVALCNRADHYIFCPVVSIFLLLSFFMAALCNMVRTLYFCPVISIFFLLSFFRLIISAVGDWMSTILPHMVWP